MESLTSRIRKECVQYIFTDTVQESSSSVIYFMAWKHSCTVLVLHKQLNILFKTFPPMLINVNVYYTGNEVVI